MRSPTYAAALHRVIAELEILDAVISARKNGMTWGRNGEMLGISGEAARQKYGKLIAA
ncbi:hypothetical protein [Spelaeicoccus albus]|uniref:hypothetical protein n=1 Tax=Spelaeicoccus albus TaxID=1280376 RepID=UPI001F2EA2B6|nr:hypothetical protein [Spelaeicoccus albus]